MSHYRAEAVYEDGNRESYERVPLGVYSTLEEAINSIKDRVESQRNIPFYDSSCWYYSICQETIGNKEYLYADVIISPKLLISEWEKWKFGESVE